MGQTLQWLIFDAAYFIVSHLEYVNVMAEKTTRTYFFKASDIVTKFEKTRNCTNTHSE